MRRNENTDKGMVYLGVGILILLFILVPCNVRNAVQASLSLKQTEVLNPSKTSLIKASCTAFEREKFSNRSSKISTKIKLEATPTLIPSSLCFVESDKLAFAKNYVGNRLTPPIPYYILYQNFKVYL
ncbi:hypothetical protein [Saccharicrinis carchari]|nr:hypothetical protein [Saccharicrinis carchari]